MKIQQMLSQLDEPRATLILMQWLRALTTCALYYVSLIMEATWKDEFGGLVDWTVLWTCMSLAVLLTVYCQWLLSKPVRRRMVFIVLILDITLWCGMIFASGGTINPAISYLLVLLCVAALSLSLTQASLLGLLAVLLYAQMMTFQPGHHHGHMMGWHLWGMWALFFMNAFIMLGVITLLGRSLRSKDQAIAEYREETVRNEQLVAMGTMAANIAHELGTPLSTISIMLEDYQGENADILRAQTQRCKNTLQKLKLAIEQENVDEVYSKDFLDRLQHETQLLKPDATISCTDDLKKDLKIAQLFEQALLALLNNAIDATDGTVYLRFSQSNDEVTIEIKHDGEQISDDLLRNLGHRIVSSEKEGLGIGYYLANASLERFNARLEINNLDQGVINKVYIPTSQVGITSA